MVGLASRPALSPEGRDGCGLSVKGDQPPCPSLSLAFADRDDTTNEINLPPTEQLNFASSQSGEQGQRDNGEEVTRLAVGTCFNQPLPLVPVERTSNVGPRFQHEADTALLRFGL